MSNGPGDETRTDDPLPTGQADRPLTDKAPRALSFGKPLPEVARPPRYIAGGFQQVGEDLEHRSREWVGMVRLLDQHRLSLDSAEQERDRLTARLDAMMPQVEESGRSLKTMLDTAKSGDISGDLAAEFDRNMRSLDELERTATALSANFLQLRSAWEQYARSVIRGQQMREDRK